MGLVRIQPRTPVVQLAEVERQLALEAVPEATPAKEAAKKAAGARWNAKDTERPAHGTATKNLRAINRAPDAVKPRKRRPPKGWWFTP